MYQNDLTLQKCAFSNPVFGELLIENATSYRLVYIVLCTVMYISTLQSSKQHVLYSSTLGVQSFSQVSYFKMPFFPNITFCLGSCYVTH